MPPKLTPLTLKSTKKSSQVSAAIPHRSFIFKYLARWINSVPAPIQKPHPANHELTSASHLKPSC